MDTHKKRNSFSIKTKLKIIEQVQSGKKRNEVAKEFNIAISTLSKIIKNSKNVEKNYLALKNLNRKKNRKPKYEDLNNEMSKWADQMIKKGAQVTGPILLEKAQQFAIKLDIPDFQATSGWLQRWKKRENIYLRKRHREGASSVDRNAVIDFKQNVLPTLLNEYELDNIYSADESGLLYKALPKGSSGYRTQPDWEYKIPKDRITLLFIANATGSDKYIYSVGNYRQSRCFHEKNFPIPYKYNSNAWITSAIWCEIIKELSEILKKRKKNILLLVNNTSCHKLDFIPENIKIIFLPPCTTSIIQPLDQGIISSFKTHYRKNLIREQILAIEGDYMEKFLQSITVLRALYIIKRSWWLVTPQTIQNCFKMAGIFKEDESNRREIFENNLEDEYGSFIEEIADFESNCFGALSDSEVKSEPEEDDEVVCESSSKPSRKEAIKSLFILKQYIGSDDSNIINIENILYNQHDKSLIKRKINDYYKSN